MSFAHSPDSCFSFPLSLSPSLPVPLSPPNPAAPSLCLSGRPAADAAAEAQASRVQRHAGADCQVQHGLHGQGGKVSHPVVLLELFSGFSVGHQEEGQSYQCELEAVGVFVFVKPWMLDLWLATV